MLVCLIDDDDDDVELFSEALRDVQPDIECVDYQKIPSALQHLREGTVIPSFIFLDAHLPSGNSKDLLTELRKMQNLNRVKIFIYSGFVSEKDSREFKSRGATDVITKPPNFNELRSLLARIIVKEESI